MRQKILFDSFVCLFVCSQEPCVDKQPNPLMALEYSSSKKKLFLILPPALSPEALMLTLQILHCPCSPENSFICSTVSQRKVVLSAPQVLENVSSHHQLHLLVRYIILVFKQRAFFAPVDKVIVGGPKQNRPHVMATHFLPFQNPPTLTGRCQTGSLLSPGKETQHTDSNHRGTT